MRARYHMTVGDTQEFDRAVRLYVFQRTVDTGIVPQPPDIAAALGHPLDAVELSLRRLADGRELVLASASSSIWMANPFSAVPTDFKVTSRGRTYFGNCIWDALGIPAILGADGLVETVCGDCGESMAIEIRSGALAGGGIVHFAVPARRWWVNVGFT